MSISGYVSDISMIVLGLYLHDFIKQDRFDFQVFKVANVSRCLDWFLILR